MPHHAHRRPAVSRPQATHGTFGERSAAGITQGMIRVAMGLDDVADIEADLARGLNTL